MVRVIPTCKLIALSQGQAIIKVYHDIPAQDNTQAHDEYLTYGAVTQGTIIAVIIFHRPTVFSRFPSGRFKQFSSIFLGSTNEACEHN